MATKKALNYVGSNKKSKSLKNYTTATKNINLLIIASSDMNGTSDNFNIPENVVNITFPCAKYNGKLADKNTRTFYYESPRCKVCNYTEIEHTYEYPLFPLHSKKYKLDTVDTNDNVSLYGHIRYSDFWKNKLTIFERIKFIYGDDININYHTITPEYVNDLSYLPTISKINNIVNKKLKLKGNITYSKPYHFSCMLNEIYNQPDYKNTKYDCIFVVGGGYGWLYTDGNFKIMSELLRPKSKVAVIGNLWYMSMFDNPEYDGKFKFKNPINSCICDSINPFIPKETKTAIKKCIKNYTKILLTNTNFIERYEMLFRTHKELIFKISIG